MDVLRRSLLTNCAMLGLLVQAAPSRAQDVITVEGERVEGQEGTQLPPDPALTPPPTPISVPLQLEDVPASLAAVREVYTPADFARYAPRNALDMIRQVPGFVIQQVEQGRGLGQASGNVLLNGERISSKSTSITEQLARIPAANVERIEVVDGATLGIPGLSGRVVNIVAQASGISGQYEWQPQLPTDFARGRLLHLTTSVSGTSGPIGWTFAATNTPFHGGSGGPNFITDAAGVVEERFSVSGSEFSNPKLSTELRISGPGSSLANLTASWQWNRSRNREDENTVVAPGEPFWLEEIRTSNDGYNYEISGDVQFALGPGRLKLIALESYRKADFATRSVIDPGTGAPSTGTRFTQANKTGERIGRAEYNWQMWQSEWQLSGEAAFNRLDRVAGLFALSGAGEFVPVPFPSGTGGVTEDRYEAALSFSRPLTHSLSLQLSAGGEYSRIDQTGVNALSRSFQRPSGSASLAWAPLAGVNVSAQLARTVGQLQFGDILARVNVSDDNTNAGNNQLRPEQSWEFDLEVVKDLGAWGSLTVAYFDDRITDFVIVVPLTSGGEAIGNIDSARVHGLLLEGTIRLDPLGLTGAKFDLSAELRKSKLRDPLTGENRPFDLARPHNIDLDFRHDLPGTTWAYGAGIRTTGFEPYYRLAEFGDDYNNPTNLSMFVEQKDLFGLTVQARVSNLLLGDSVFDRVVFAGPRNSSPILYAENRRRELGRTVNLSVKGNF